METTNFNFLKKHEPLFFQLAATSEKAFSADPNTTLFKLRQLSEALAQDVACSVGAPDNFMDYFQQVGKLVSLPKICRGPR